MKQPRSATPTGVDFVPDWFRKSPRNVPNLRASVRHPASAATTEIPAICRQKVTDKIAAFPLAMQKVEGSSPFSRFKESPANERLSF